LHFRIAGRALLHHSDLVTLFPGSVVKGLFPVVHHKDILLAVAKLEFEKGVVVVPELVYFDVDKGNQPAHVSPAVGRGRADHLLPFVHPARQCKLLSIEAVVGTTDSPGL
jgi:hypothetical protein